MSDDLKFKVGWDGRDAVQGLKDTTSVLGDFIAELKKSRDAVTSLSAWTDVIGKVRSSFGSLMDVVRDAAQKAEVGEIFQRYAASVGVAGDVMVSSMKKASKGLIGESDLMRGAMKALQLGVTTSSEEMGRLWEIARAKGKLLGRDTVDVFNQIVEAIGKGRTRTLIDLGFLPESFAKAKTGADLLLTRTEALSVVMRQGSKDAKLIGDAGLTAADQFIRFDLAVAGLKKSIVGLAPSISPAVEGMTDMVNYAKDGVKWIGSHRDEVNLLAAAYAGAKIGEVAGQFVELAGSLSLATMGQKALNAAAMLNPYMIIGAELAYLAKEYYDMSTETQRWTGYTEDQEKAMEKMATSGSTRMAQLVVDINKVKLATLEASQAAIGDIKSLEERLQTLGQKHLNSELSQTGDPRILAGREPTTAEQMAQGRAYNETLEKVSQWKQLQKAIEETQGKMALFEAHGQAGFSKLVNAGMQLLGVASGLSGGIRKADEDLGKFGKGGQKSLEDIQKKGERAEKAISRISEEILKGFGITGKDAIEDAENALLSATKAAGGFALALKSGVTAAGQMDAETQKLVDRFSQAALSGTAKITSPEETVSKAASGMMDMMGVGWILRGEGQKPSSREIESRAREVIEQPLSRVFNDALVEGLEGGDFFKALGSGIKKTVISALANSITEAIFGQSGSIIGTTGSSSGGNGIVGGLMQPIFHSKAAGGGINWAGLGTNIAIGAAASWLTSPGRIFGGTVTHGGEAVQQASDINQQVSLARSSRDSLLVTALGISKETANLLREIQFQNATYSWDTSGNGVTSKKTKTYSLNASAANSALEEYAKASAMAVAQAAKREFEKTIIAISSPTTALSMTIKDLRDSIDRWGGLDESGNTIFEMSDEVASIRVQLAQAEADAKAYKVQRSGEYLDFLLENPYGISGMGSYPGWSGPVPGSTYAFNAATSFGGYGPGAGSMINGMSWEDWSAINDISLMMSGIKGQSAKSFDWTSRLATAGISGDYAATKSVLEEQKSALADRISLISEIMTAAEAAAGDATLTVTERTKAFEKWQQANSEYWAAKLEALDIENQLIQTAKTKQSQFQSDILTTLLTRVGEIQTSGSRQIIVMTGGQPDGRALVSQLISSLNGENPELAAALTTYITTVGKPYWG